MRGSYLGPRHQTDEICGYLDSIGAKYRVLDDDALAPSELAAAEEVVLAPAARGKVPEISSQGAHSADEARTCPPKKTTCFSTSGMVAKSVDMSSV